MNSPTEPLSTTRPLSGQVALVTGASRGIGACIARALAQAGAAVAVNYLNNRDLALAVARECQSYGAQALAVQADVTDLGAIARLLQETQLHLGSPTILVNNAGRAHTGLFADTDEAMWTELADANLKAPFFCTRAVLPGMLKAGYGRIINISSVWGIAGGSCEVAYSATKGGLIAFTKALAKEIGRSGITVNAVAPGAIATDMLARLSNEDRELLSQETPVGRLGAPADVAAAVLFLASPDASFMTGQVLSPNGGLVM
ncbi:MAG: elongation factor P 5-aminopentanone reductase [Bacilli bacterium]